MATVVQPTSRPTNKMMTAAAVGPAATEAWGAIMADIYPPLAGPEMSILAGVIASALVAYMVKDRPNVLLLK